jgi:hypothetical protein
MVEKKIQLASTGQEAKADVNNEAEYKQFLDARSRKQAITALKALLDRGFDTIPDYELGKIQQMFSVNKLISELEEPGWDELLGKGYEIFVELTTNTSPYQKMSDLAKGVLQREWGDHHS